MQVLKGDRSHARYIVRMYDKEWRELHKHVEPLSAHQMLVMLDEWNLVHQQCAKQKSALLDIEGRVDFIELEVVYVEA